MVDLANYVLGDELVPQYTSTLQQLKVVNIEIHADMSNNVYHQDTKGLSSSLLKQCTTPIHLKSHYNNPKVYDKEAMKIGTALHTILLEPNQFEYESFDEEEIVARVVEETGSKKPRGTNRYKELISLYLDDAGDIQENYLKKHTYNSLLLMYSRMRTNEELLTLMDGAECEKSFIVTYSNGLVCKVRPDGLKVATAKDQILLSEYGVKEGDIIILSVKTTMNASFGNWDGFLSQCRKLNYFMAEAFYQDVISSIYPDKPIHTVFVVCEKNKDVFSQHLHIRPVENKHITKGRENYSENLDVYLHCQETKDYAQGYEFFNNGSIIFGL